MNPIKSASSSFVRWATGRLFLLLLIVLFALVTARASAADLYVVSQGSNSFNGGVYKIPPSGNPSIFFSGLSTPTGIAIDSVGNVFVGDFATKINKFTPAATRSIFASGIFPVGLAFDPSGNLFESDADGIITKFTAAGVPSTFAAGLSNVQGIAFDGMGNLFLADGENTIYKYSPVGVRSTLASFSNGPVGLAVDPSGDLFASVPDSGTIYKFTPGGVESIFASGLARPWGLACDANGNLFDAEYTTGVIYEFSPSGSRSTFATGLVHPQFMSFFPTTVVPEPSAWILALFGAVAIGFGVKYALPSARRPDRMGKI